jgi:hypothetical protein
MARGRVGPSSADGLGRSVSAGVFFVSELQTGSLHAYNDGALWDIEHAPTLASRPTHALGSARRVFNKASSP